MFCLQMICYASWVPRVLASWIGHADLRAVNENATVGVGPVAQALDSGKFDAAFLLTDHDAEGGLYLRWLKERSDGVEIHLRRERLTGPTEFGEIYTAAVRACEQAIAVAQGDALTFHLSPGTPAMAAVWIILGKTRFPAAMIESSLKHGVKTVSVPFDIAADFLPDLLRQPDRELERLSAGLPPEAPEFDAIIHRSPAMRHRRNQPHIDRGGHREPVPRGSLLSACGGRSQAPAVARACWRRGAPGGPSDGADQRRERNRTRLSGQATFCVGKKHYAAALLARQCT